MIRLLMRSGTVSLLTDRIIGPLEAVGLRPPSRQKLLHRDVAGVIRNDTKP